ncbi:MAG: protein kinase [Acidobacteriota bacterium]
MTPSRWQQIEELHQAALRLGPAERSVFLNSIDPELRRGVATLLAETNSIEDATLTLVGAGAQLGPYKIEASIGKGGMGEVFRAVDTRLDRKVAIKTSNKQFDARFEREARAISSLNHPHICTLYDVGPNYIVMELVEGETLAERLKKGKLSIDDTLRYGSQIAGALAEAHSKGITHRDLKPGNVMLSKNGVKVLDFGLAKLHTHPDDGLTQANVIMGTPAYMAPEQREGKECDGRADTYSLGLVLYEMASGKRAPQGETPPLEHLPEKLAHLIERCLAKAPDDRWQSTSDVSRELQWIKDNSVSGAPAAVRAVAGHGWKWVAVVVVLAAAALAWKLIPGRASSEIHTIALLPLDNLSGDASQEYFADGMTEQLITDMSRISSLHVISRSSVMRYRGDRRNLREIAKELGADMILTGSVLRVENRVRINAQLFQMPEEKNLWAESFDRDLKDILTLQAGVARTVADQIRVQLTPLEATRLATVSPIDPETHELYLQGKFFANQFTEEGLVKGIDYFQQAISRNPDYADAYSGIAFAYTQLASFYRAPKDTMPKAREAAVKALALDSSLAEPHIWLGMIQLYFDWDWPGAERELKRALELNPSSADAHLLYEDLLSALGRLDEATQEAKRSLDLDPLSVRMLVEAQFTYLLAGQYDRAIAIGGKLTAIDPKLAVGHVYTGVAYSQQKQLEPALRELEMAVQLEPNNVTANGFLAHVRALAGDREGAHRILDALKARKAKRYTCAFEIAMAYTTLGEKDEAFRWLNTGVEDRADCMIWIKSEPWMKPLQSDPRFQSVASKVGLP